MKVQIQSSIPVTDFWNPKKCKDTCIVYFKPFFYCCAFLSDGWVASRRRSVGRSVCLSSKFQPKFQHEIQPKIEPKYQHGIQPKSGLNFMLKFGLSLVMKIGLNFVLNFGLNFILKFGMNFVLKFMLTFVLKVKIFC